MKTRFLHTGNLICAGLFLFASGLFAQDPNFHIYIAFGQSNMEGQGIISSEDQVANSRFRLMPAVTCSNLGRTQGLWAAATAPLCRCDTKLSPVDYFGRTLVDSLPSTIKIGVVHVAVAGCGIDLFDKTNYATYASTAASWMQTIITQYGGNPYARMIAMAKLAQQDGVIKGILFHQGETDAYSSAWGTKVKKIYNDILTDLGLSADSVPFLAGEVVPASTGGTCAGANTQIDALPNIIPTAHVVSSAGLEDGGDNLHFNAASYRELGKRYAQTMLKLLGSSGSLSSSSIPASSSSAVAQGAYSSMATIPGTVQMENYDVGGEEVAYHDNDETNQGGVYRTDGVDIVGDAADGYKIGYTVADEWLEYTVSVTTSAVYDWVARVAAGGDSAAFRMSIDGTDITDRVQIPTTGTDWNTYTTINGITKAALAAGTHVLRITIDRSYGNIDWISFTEHTSGLISPTGSSMQPNLATYQVFNLQGKKLGIVKASDILSLRAALNQKVPHSGMYLIRQGNNIQRIVIQKR